MMIVAYETGAREGEIRGLRRSDIDFKRHTATLALWAVNLDRNVPPYSPQGVAMAENWWARRDSNSRPTD